MKEVERNRYKILIARENEVLERLFGRISNLNNRTIALLSLNLVILTLILTSLLYIRDNDVKLPVIEFGLFVLAAEQLFFSGAICSVIFKPTTYNELNIYENVRFHDLIGMNEKELLSNNLADIKDTFELNEKIYNRFMWWFKVSYYLHVSAFGVLFILIIILL